MIIVNIIATNKYIGFVHPLIESAERYFIPGLQKKYLIHTNILDFRLGNSVEVILHPIEHEPWPFSTLKRFHYFLDCDHILQQSKFSYYIDADSLFVGEIDAAEVFGSLIGTLHPYLGNSSGTPEMNPASTAYIPYNTSRYFCGGFFGGTSSEFVKMSQTIKNNIDKDLSNNIIAVWHDESHINKYFYSNPPEIVLPVGYGDDENLNRVNSRIHFLDKSKLGGSDYFRT